MSVAPHPILFLSQRDWKRHRNFNCVSESIIQKVNIVTRNYYEDIEVDKNIKINKKKR